MISKQQKLMHSEVRQDWCGPEQSGQALPSRTNLAVKLMFHRLMLWRIVNKGAV